MVPPTRQLISLLLFLLPLFGDSKWYYVSYRLHTQRFLPVREHIYVSRAMVAPEVKTKPLCTFVTDAESFESFAREKNRLLEECLFRQGVLVTSRERTLNLTDDGSHLLLRLPPTLLKVEFNDGLVIINQIDNH
ncbi:hypothetical protein [Hydrogenimonas sp. SS33]|uniref:hypothetical protein n=1 Tax=Hydrogenimonas leucolamina TaxID=2954236 RepID=UPI00336BB891